MPFTEDLSVFFRTEDFGTAAVYSGSGATINGIFDTEYEEPMGRVQAYKPIFVCRTSDVPTASHGQTLVIGAVTYKIRGVEPDGTGITMLRLEKQ
jgi:hypothetical protein